MPASLARSSRRHLARHPAQLVLAVLGVALGVAVVVSIDLANASASRAFRLATESVTGRATHQVVAGSAGVPDEVFRRLVVEAGVDDAAPVVEAWAEVESRREPDGAGGEARTLRLLGVDPLAEPAFRPWLTPPDRQARSPDSAAEPGAEPGEEDRVAAAGGTTLAALLTRPGAALLSAATAAELGVAVGDELPVRLAGREERLVIVGLLEPGDELARQALADLAVLDIAAAQELTGSLGRLDRIDLIVPPGEPGRRLLARARRVLPPQARLAAAAARSRSTEQMTRAFRLNLQGLSLLALVCGLFLIYNAMTFSVVQRRRQLGVLRAVGVTRGQVFALVLGEAAALAVAGTAAGLALGVVLAHGMVGLVTRTLNDLYFVVTVRELALAPATLAKGTALGLLATVAAAAVPAWEATTATPGVALQRSQLESGLRRALPRVTGLAVALLAAGALLLALPLRTLAPAFLGLFAVILGFALLAPLATLLLMRGAAPVAGRAFGVLGRLAARGVTAALSRTAVAIAALALAVSVTVGVAVMVESFRGTVERWLAGTLTEDVYVSPAGGAGAAASFEDAPLAPQLARRLATVAGVARVHTILRIEVPEPDGGELRRQRGVLERRGGPGAAGGGDVD
ncbi:MAG TPA: ABC transporter permease, partial [Thermoanaerobaculia bacterium]|nr:ABC transporter permease [Thermoanaerobaculia bacterium]